MTTKYHTDYSKSRILPALALALIMPFASAGNGQHTIVPTTHLIVAPPICINHSGEAVRFIDRNNAQSDIAAGMAIKDRRSMPVVVRSNYSNTPPEFQKFIDRHECAHHQTGDVGRPHPPRNSSAHLMNESVSDCIAILRLRDEDKFAHESLDKIVGVMRHDMTKAGFPEISISSRTSNIRNCFAKSSGSQDLVNRILKQRGHR